MKKRAVLYSLCATAMTVSGLVAGAVPASASIHNTRGYVHIVNAGSGKCIDATDAGAVQWRCLNTFNEEWQFVDVLYAQGFEIVSHASGDCLTAVDSGPGFWNGTPVVLAPCSPGDTNAAQVWVPNGDPFILGNVFYNSACLDLENGDTSDGVPMQLWSCNFITNNQRWKQL